MTRKIKMPPPCFDFLHAELLSAENGRAVVRFIPTEQMENPYGSIQGGIIAGMLDNVFGPAVVSAMPSSRTSTIQMSVNYLRSVKAGEPIIGIAQVVKLGRTQVLIEARMERESDRELLVMATATNLIRQ